MPDAATGVAALQTGEQDWQETTPHDLLPVLKRAGDIETRILDPRGYACMLRVNHLQPPFDNPADPPRAVGRDRSVRLHDGGRGRRSRLSGLADRLLCAGHADGERCRPRRVPRAARHGEGQGRSEGRRLQWREDGAARPDQLARAKAARRHGGRHAAAGRHERRICRTGFRRRVAAAVEEGADRPGRLERRRRQLAGHRLAQSGRQHQSARRRQGRPAGTRARRWGRLRSQWLAAAELAEQQRICRDIQALSFEEIPYFPIGQYKQPTAYRTGITGILDGTAVFWNVRPA